MSNLTDSNAFKFAKNALNVHKEFVQIHVDRLRRLSDSGCFEHRIIFDKDVDRQEVLALEFHLSCNGFNVDIVELSGGYYMNVNWS